MSNITVVTPTIPPRVCNGLLQRSNESVRRQTLRPSGGISVSVDVDKAGAAITRQRALDAVRTEWVAFLDDDDYLYPQHLQVLYDLVSSGYDYAYSWFDGNNPFPMHRGRQFDPKNPHHTTMTVMVRTELAKDVGFIGQHPDDWILPYEDWKFTLGCAEAGGKFIGTGEITWHYAVHGQNTSGVPTRW